MSWRRGGVWLTAALLAALVLLAAGCQSFMEPKHSKPPKWTPKTLAVLPFQEILPETGDAGLARSPITFAVYTSGNILPEAVGVLNQALAARLPRITTVALVGGRRVGTTALRVNRGGLYGNQRQAIAALGRELKVDGVLVGYVYRFQTREGGDLAVSKASSVAFDLSLVRSSDGAVVWKNSFDQTQQPLSDDVLRLGEYAKHGLRWLTAAEFARFGLDQLLADFPWRKKTGE